MRLPRHYPARLTKDSPQPWLPLSLVEKFVPLAKDWGVSEVARSRRGFLAQYRQYTPANMDPWWQDRRHNFNARHLEEAKMYGEEPFTEDGLPSPRHLAMIIWAYSPWPDIVKRIAKTL